MADKDEKIKEMLSEIEKGVDEIYESDNYREFLDTMSQFTRYSLNNTLLIYRQYPGASLVAGYKSWEKNFERHVKSGEKAIRILAPMKRNITVSDGVDELGEEKKRTVEYITYRPVCVFDVSQTEGKELPKPVIVNELEGNVERFEDYMEAIRAVAPFHIDIRNVESEAKGWCDYTSEVIVIKSGMSQLQTLKTAIHETAHGIAHTNNDKSKEQKEVEAESIAYVVCRHLGLDTSDYSFGYVASWAKGKQHELLVESMQTIADVSNEIIGELEKEPMERTKQTAIKDVIKQGTKNFKRELAELDRDAVVGESRFIHGYNVEGGTRIIGMVDYDGAVPESELFERVKRPMEDNAEVIMLPNRVSKNELVSDLQISDAEKDDTWPMVDMTGCTLDYRLGGLKNIYSAFESIKEQDEYCRENNLPNHRLHIKVKYTYMGKQRETDGYIYLGRGETNFVDYLPVPAEIKTYLKRHISILEVCEKSKNENRIAERGTKMQARYEDSILTWAEKERLKLNYQYKPEIESPPEWNPALVKQYEKWEVER